MVLPLKTDKGLITYFSQCDGPNFGLVELEKFRNFGPSAEASVWLQSFLDFEETKKITLLLIHFRIHEVNRNSALNLAETLLRLYCSSKSNWAQRFNENPSSFDFSEYLEDLKI